MAIWNILRTFGIVYDPFVHFVLFLWYNFPGLESCIMKNLATLAETRCGEAVQAPYDKGIHCIKENPADFRERQKKFQKMFQSAVSSFDCKSGLPDGLFSNQKSKFGQILEGLAMEDVGIFYGHLVHFTVFCFI
jgi:hypothetical protein